jgi:phosphoribosylamine--glycine ligase
MTERVLVVGSGAREHALVWKLAQSARIGELFCAPGNGGTAELAESIPLRATDLDGIVAVATARRIDLVVIGPDDPVAAGLADRLRAAGLRAFGPSAAAARIESSKSWAKALMTEAGVPTARAVVVTALADALAALADFAYPVVVKADGLAAGKGVVIAENREDARSVLTAFLEDNALGAAGRTVLIEEYLVGREASVFALTDGETIRLLPPARDYKRVADGDRGPNTGGMGAYAPLPDLDDALLETIRTTIMEPTVRALAARDAPFQGVLYGGLMLTAGGPKVIEFNARFGDPEAQVLLPLLAADLLDLLGAIADGNLASASPLPPPTRAAVGIVLASGGYPGPYSTGLPIEGLAALPADILAFHAGTRHDDNGRLVTAGGRVLTLVAQAPDLPTARSLAYAAAPLVTFPGRHFRTDIAT